jgi:Domain of unknown function (DUF4136)
MTIRQNFSPYHNYYWEKVKTTDPLWQNQIQDAVDHALQSKAWQRADNGGDVAVTTLGSTRNQQEYQTFYDGMGGWRWGGMGETTTQVGNSRVLDFYDAHHKQLIWRGVSSDTLSNNPEKNEKKLDKAVDKSWSISRRMKRASRESHVGRSGSRRRGSSRVDRVLYPRFSAYFPVREHITIVSSPIATAPTL